MRTSDAIGGTSPIPRGNGGTCPRCAGTGFELTVAPDGISRARRCECAAASQTDRLLAAARIPRRYQKCDFDSFDELEPSLRLAKQEVKRFVDNYPIHAFGLLLLGPCGRGKTHLAAAALTTLIREKGVRGLFYDFRDLLKEIQASYNSVSDTTELGVLQPIFGAEVLVLDDLGATRMTDWVRDTLSHIITNRYNERRVTIFTSNIEDETTNPAVTDERVRERANLRDRIGDSLRSRLYEMCETVHVTGERDFRKDVMKHGRGRGPLL